MITKKEFVEFLGEFNIITRDEFQIIHKTDKINDIHLSKHFFSNDDTAIFLTSLCKNNKVVYENNELLSNFDDNMKFTDGDLHHDTEKNIDIICGLIKIKKLEKQMIKDTNKLPCATKLKSKLTKF